MPRAPLIITVFKQFAKTKGISEHYTFTASKMEHVKGLYHIQNVNSYHSRLKGWIRKFNRVATKYLQNYLAWFGFLDSIQFKTDDVFTKEFLVKSCVYPMKETNLSLINQYVIWEYFETEITIQT